jgi:hypothetical protein
MTQKQKDSINNTIADLENSAAIDPAGKEHYEKEIKRLKGKMLNKRPILRRAHRIARETLKEFEDFQTACVEVSQDDGCQPLFDGLSEDELFEKVEGIVRFAEHQLGFSRT